MPKKDLKQPLCFSVALAGFAILLIGGVWSLAGRLSSSPPEALFLVVLGTALLGIAAFLMTYVAKLEARVLLSRSY